MRRVVSGWAALLWEALRGAAVVTVRTGYWEARRVSSFPGNIQDQNRVLQNTP